MSPISPIQEESISANQINYSQHANFLEKSAGKVMCFVERYKTILFPAMVIYSFVTSPLHFASGFIGSVLLLDGLDFENQKKGFTAFQFKVGSTLVLSVASTILKPNLFGLTGGLLFGAYLKVYTFEKFQKSSQ